MTLHYPVLKQEVLQYMDIQPNDIVLDGTIGFGGHSQEIANQLGPHGYLIGLDQDPYALSYNQDLFKKDPRIHLYALNFSYYDDALKKSGFKQANKILLDLGYSSYQLDHAKKGFSFLKEEPLDMRMNPTFQTTAADILHRYSAQSLSDLFFKFGELHQNKKLVENILNYRKKFKILSTNDLVSIVKKSYFFKHRPLMMKTLSQVFQALRIEVNQELHHLSTSLSKLDKTLSPKGIIAIISFHSGEDKLVKLFFKENLFLFKPLHKKAIQASKEEIEKNSRSKSAKLRIFQRV